MSAGEVAGSRGFRSYGQLGSVRDEDKAFLKVTVCGTVWKWD